MINILLRKTNSLVSFASQEYSLEQFFFAKASKESLRSLGEAGNNSSEAKEMSIISFAEENNLSYDNEEHS